MCMHVSIIRYCAQKVMQIPRHSQDYQHPHYLMMFHEGCQPHDNRGCQPQSTTWERQLQKGCTPTCLGSRTPTFIVFLCLFYIPWHCWCLRRWKLKNGFQNSKQEKIKMSKWGQHELGHQILRPQLHQHIRIAISCVFSVFISHRSGYPLLI